MEKIIVSTVIAGSLEKVWQCWTEPAHIVIWNHASDDWECPRAENDLTVGGTFSATMAARDGSVSFDFAGKYTEIVPLQKIAYMMADGRAVVVAFKSLSATETKVTEAFDPEAENSTEQQKAGWQAIINNFKQHVETT